ncbi:MAG: PspA/IM30 family protein [Gammaproteobacteria bacterium]|nr:PspA/IM30 family protein [Gammaproteobacteria bacterium]
MALVNRIARLFKADLHAILDRIEEPAQLLKQAVRDMEEALAGSEQRLEAMAREQEALLARRAAIERELSGLEQELDLCFAAHKAELARGVVRRKLESQRLLQHLEARHDANERQLAELRARQLRNRAALETMQQKAAIFSTYAPANGDPVFDDYGGSGRTLALADEEIEVAFLREQQARRTP